jgi:hypothetical protein
MDALASDEQRIWVKTSWSLSNSGEVLAAYLSKWTEAIRLDEIERTKGIDSVHP